MKQGPRQTAVKFHDKLWAKASKFHDSYSPKELLGVFVRGLDISIRESVRQRWVDEMNRKFGESEQSKVMGDPQTREQLVTMLHSLAVYADAINRNAAPEEEDTKDKSKRKDKNQVSPVHTEATNTPASSPAHQLIVPPSPSFSSIPGSAPPSEPSVNSVGSSGRPPWNNYNGSQASTQYKSNYGNNQRQKRNEGPQKNMERKPSTPLPTLPRNVKFQIPPGRVDIRGAVAQLIDEYHNCRICLNPCNVPTTPSGVPPHVTSECHLLPDDPAARYDALAGRLMNISTSRGWVQHGMHAPINSAPPAPPNVPLIAAPPPSILKRPGEADKPSN